MREMGHPENLRRNKTFPPIFEHIGWCTWNSSSLGRNLNEGLLIGAAKYFRDAQFPVGWFLVDDGWFDQTGSKLNSIRPDAKKFPHGFRGIIRRLKQEYHLTRRRRLARPERVLAGDQSRIGAGEGTGPT